MLEMTKFTKIPRVEKFVNLLEDNKKETMYITEKLDGSNGSFRLHEGKVMTFSRNLPLSEENTLNGFWNWVQDNISPELLNPKYIYYGEWLTKHKIDYKEHLNNFVLFSVYDTETFSYLPFEFVEEEANKLKIELVHLFYKGAFQSLEHIKQFVGRSTYDNVEFGEGVIIFIPSIVFPRDKESQVFLKWIGEQFSEVKKVNASKPKLNTLDKLVESFVTQQRMDKILNKLQDEGLLETNLDMSDMGNTLKTLDTQFTDDIIEEELDTIIKAIKKDIQKRVPVLVKNFIQNKDE